MLWEIRHDVGSSYLFGTIHAYDHQIFKIPIEVYHAIDSCKLFAMEMDSSQLNYHEMLKGMTVTDSENTLDKILSPQSYQRVMSLDGAYGREEQVKCYKPFFVMSLVLSDYHQQLTSVDAELASFAKSKSIEVISLESFDDQINAVDAIPLNEQARMLDDAFGQNISVIDSLKKMMCLYRDQDIQGIVHNMLQQSSPVFIEEMQNKRNLRMAEQLDKIIQESKQSVFAAVGALHLPNVGDSKGMVDLLKDKGYQLDAIRIELNPDEE